jgi:hypothetical protein
MTQIPIPITVEVSASAATPEVASASLYPSLLASVDAMADPELWVLMEAIVYSLRQRDTLTRSIKECGTIECFGDKWPQDFDFLPTQSEGIAIVEAIIDQFSSRQLHSCWRSLMTACNRTQKLALIEAITYARTIHRRYSKRSENANCWICLGIPWNTWMYGSLNPKRCA